MVGLAVTVLVGRTVVAVGVAVDVIATGSGVAAAGIVGGLEVADAVTVGEAGFAVTVLVGGFAVAVEVGGMTVAEGVDVAVEVLVGGIRVEVAVLVGGINVAVAVGGIDVEVAVLVAGMCVGVAVEVRVGGTRVAEAVAVGGNNVTVAVGGIGEAVAVAVGGTGVAVAVGGIGDAVAVAVGVIVGVVVLVGGTCVAVVVAVGVLDGGTTVDVAVGVVEGGIADVVGVVIFVGGAIASTFTDGDPMLAAVDRGGMRVASAEAPGATGVAGWLGGEADAAGGLDSSVIVGVEPSGAAVDGVWLASTPLAGLADVTGVDGVLDEITAIVDVAEMALVSGEAARGVAACGDSAAIGERSSAADVAAARTVCTGAGFVEPEPPPAALPIKNPIAMLPRTARTTTMRRVAARLDPIDPPGPVRHAKMSAAIK